MGAWIEIPDTYALLLKSPESHPTMGAWIEIIDMILCDLPYGSRTPRWVRGLKYNTLKALNREEKSHPTMGAWIEIKTRSIFENERAWSHPTMGAWIEIATGTPTTCI